MSAEILRRAAEEIHRDAQAMCDEEWRFYRAVADLLDGQAALVEEHGGFFDIEAMGDANAVAVARAYLGGSA